MAFEYINTLRSSSIARVIDTGTTIALANLSAGANETVTAASIRKVAWSTSGYISITRNGAPVLNLHNSGSIQFDDLNTTLANNSTHPIVVVIGTGGFLVLELTKEATYTTAPGGY
jgi:dethiobiotin synthetase